MAARNLWMGYNYDVVRGMINPQVDRVDLDVLDLGGYDKPLEECLKHIWMAKSMVEKAVRIICIAYGKSSDMTEKDHHFLDVLKGEIEELVKANRMWCIGDAVKCTLSMAACLFVPRHPEGMYFLSSVFSLLDQQNISRPVITAGDHYHRLDFGVGQIVSFIKRVRDACIQVDELALSGQLTWSTGGRSMEAGPTIECILVYPMNKIPTPGLSPNEFLMGIEKDSDWADSWIKFRFLSLAMAMNLKVEWAKDLAMEVVNLKVLMSLLAEKISWSADMDRNPSLHQRFIRATMARPVECLLEKDTDPAHHTLMDVYKAVLTMLETCVHTNGFVDGKIQLIPTLRNFSYNLHSTLASLEGFKRLELVSNNTEAVFVWGCLVVLGLVHKSGCFALYPPMWGATQDDDKTSPILKELVESIRPSHMLLACPGLASASFLVTSKLTEAAISVVNMTQFESGEQLKEFTPYSQMALQPDQCTLSEILTHLEYPNLYGVKVTTHK